MGGGGGGGGVYSVQFHDMGISLFMVASSMLSLALLRHFLFHRFTLLKLSLFEFTLLNDILYEFTMYTSLDLLSIKMPPPVEI